MDLWKVRVRGRLPIGPLATDLIVAGIQRGKVPLDAEVCREGTAVWRPIGTVAAFYTAMGLAGGPTLADDEEATEVTTAPRQLDLPEELRPTRVMGTYRDNLPTDADEEDATAVLDPPPFRSSRPTPAALPRSPAPVPPPPSPAASNLVSASPAPIRSVEPPGRQGFVEPLLDADDDEFDVRVERPAPAILPAAGRPARLAGPEAMRGAQPRITVDRADEVTAPAQRLRRERQRLRQAVIALSIAAGVLLLVLLMLLIGR